MAEFISEIAKALGVPTIVVEGGLITLLMFANIGLIKLLNRMTKDDSRQISFQEQLVKMAADSAADSREHMKAYEANAAAIRALAEVTSQAIKDNSQSIKENALATKESSLVSQELVRVVRDLTNTFPERITAHEEQTVKLFMDKADEMHLVTVRRDAEMEDDRGKREENQRTLVEKLDGQRAVIEVLVKELTDDTDETTLRSELNTIVRAIDEMLAVIKTLVP